MSLNTAHANGSVLIYSGEPIHLYTSNVNLEFVGAREAEMKGTKHGKIYLTSHRLIFLNNKATDGLKSFSFPYVALKDIDIEQPVFGANYMKGIVVAQPGGNWSGECKFKLSFKSGGAIEFGQAMIKCVALAKRSQQYNQIPPYIAPTGPTFPAPPPAYSAPGYYGWMPPPQMFPEAPPANSVYMTDCPPPYPGIGGTPSPPYAGAAGGFQQMPTDAKAAEAAQSAYYDPNTPQYAYVPPPAYYESPPSYTQAMNHKKEQ